MNKNQKIFAGFITEFFTAGRAPAWKDVSEALSANAIDKMTGTEYLPDSFLEVLFKDNAEMIKIIPELGFSNHQLIQQFVIFEYNLDNCRSCGCFSKKTLCHNGWNEREDGEDDEEEAGPDDGGHARPNTPEDGDSLPNNVIAELLRLHAELNAENLPRQGE